MLVRNLALKNIRSYDGDEGTTMDFPEGVVLIEGDIGSGKSSLLYALEFALFGFSDFKGSYLLNEGRKDGRVSVTFETEGTEYTIERSLRVKGKDVVQEECRISTSGEWERLSPSDLKERVVSILGFNEPIHPNAASQVYRYAVFTPQEQMKQILMQNPEERLQIIRRVLGTQSYQTAAENSGTVERKVREAALGRRKAAEDLEEKKDEVEEVTTAMSHLEADVPLIEQREAAAAKLVRALDARWKESLRDREALKGAEARIPRLEEDVADLKEEMTGGEERIGGLETQLTNEIEPVVKRFEGTPRPALDSKEAEGLLNRMRETLTHYKDSKRAIEEEIEKTRDLVKKGVCPLCGQRISGDIHTRTEHSERELTRLGEQITSSEGELDRLTLQLESIRAFEEGEKEFQRASKERSRLEKELSSCRRKLQQDNMKLSRALSELKEVTARAKEMSALSREIDELESKLNDARGEEKTAALELTRGKQELADSSKRLEHLLADVKKKEASLQESRRLTTYQNWLAEYFRPTVELIEKQTLSQAAARFNDHFQRFFTSLVDDPDMVVRVKEDFSPVFEREGFEQDFEALSGGERTSMALAYRFALNSVVKETVSSRPELVILDEPTDGFSKEQVFKMRGLLDELDSRQVILVSHEKELESMADHIFRVEKRNGTSSVSRVRT